MVDPGSPPSTIPQAKQPTTLFGVHALAARMHAKVRGACNIPRELQTSWTKRMRGEIRNLTKHIGKLDKTGEDGALDLVSQAPDLIQSGSDVRKHWKKVKKALVEGS